MFQAGKSLEEKLKSSGVSHEVHIYPGCSHVFMNTSPDSLERRKCMGLTDENQEAIDLAWSRFSSWMSRFLGSA
jgi:carboxymethylenebutenolidase